MTAQKNFFLYLTFRSTTLISSLRFLMPCLLLVATYSTSMAHEPAPSVANIIVSEKVAKVVSEAVLTELETTEGHEHPDICMCGNIDQSGGPRIQRWINRINRREFGFQYIAHGHFSIDTFIDFELSLNGANIIVNKIEFMTEKSDGTTQKDPDIDVDKNTFKLRAVDSKRALIEFDYENKNNGKTYTAMMDLIKQRRLVFFEFDSCHVDSGSGGATSNHDKGGGYGG